MTWKTEIKQKAAEDIGIGLDQLIALLPKDSESFDDCLVFQSRFRKFKKEKFRGTETREALNREQNKLLADIIEYVNSIEDGIIVNQPISRENDQKVFYEKIVVCCSLDRMAYMEQFFSKYYFKNVVFYEGNKNILENADLILFDDMAPSDTAKILLKEILDDNHYVIYFGFLFPLDRKIYNDQIYFANSIFSLYARIKEMLDFLKYINPK